MKIQIRKVPIARTKKSREEDDGEHQQDKARRSKSCDIDAPRAALVD